MTLPELQNVGLRFDMRAPDFGPPPADLYAAALEQCEWADAHGFGFVRLNEHHGSADGYLPSPLIMAAAIAARTSKIRIRLTVLVLPLHDPVRVAEDAAVVDLISRGRLEIVVAGGYRSTEFAMFGKRIEDRSRLVVEGITAMRAAWSGDPFVVDGRRALVGPKPFNSKGIPLILGGSSEGAARRAARLADGFEPTTAEFNDAYRDERVKVTGLDPGPVPDRFPLLFLMVSEDPDAMWRAVGRNLLHDANTYGEWKATERRSSYSPIPDYETLRAAGKYSVMTPDDCVTFAQSITPTPIELQPLLGGIDPDIGWESLRLFASKVLPHLEAR